jgi:hypothetical protein
MVSVIARAATNVVRKRTAASNRIGTRFSRIPSPEPGRSVTTARHAAQTPTSGTAQRAGKGVARVAPTSATSVSTARAPANRR